MDAEAELRARLHAVMESIRAAEASVTDEQKMDSYEAILESCEDLDLLVAKEAEAASKKRKHFAELKDECHCIRAHTKELVTDIWNKRAEDKSREQSAAAARIDQLESEVQADKKRLVEAEAAFKAEKTKMELELVRLRRALVKLINGDTAAC